jgi:elongation factor 3
LDALHAFALNKKSGYERESAAVGLHSLASVVGAPAAPLLLQSLPHLYDLYMDKGEVVRNASMEAVKAILKLYPPESTGLVFRTLEGVVEKGKWKAKVGALDSLKMFVKTARENVANELGSTLPKVELALHDTKQEVPYIHTLCCSHF